jgi:hypothetical protein
MELLISQLLAELLYIPNILLLSMLIIVGFMYRRLDSIDKNFECRVQSSTKKNYLMTLRLLIISDEVPAEEKMKRYDEYKRLGGNSWIDNYIDNVVRPKINGGMPHRRKNDNQEI